MDSTVSHCTGRAAPETEKTGGQVLDALFNGNCDVHLHCINRLFLYNVGDKMKTGATVQETRLYRQVDELKAELERYAYLENQIIKLQGDITTITESITTVAHILKEHMERTER